MQTRARTVNRSLRDQPTAVNRPAATQKAAVAKPAAAQKTVAAKPVTTEAAKPGIVVHKVAKPASSAAQKAPRPSAVPKPPAAAKPSAAPAAAAAPASTAGAGTYVRAPVPKAIKQVVPRTTKKPAPPKRFVAPYNPYENMSKDGFHCVRCHRDINVGGEKHYFCLIPHVFDRNAWEAVAEKYEGLGGDRALKFGKIREIPVTAPACCSDAQLNARGQVELGAHDEYDAPHEDSYSIPDEDSYHEDSYHDASDQEHIDTLLPPIIIRSSLWIPDGNIVLEAEHTQFKFYRGLLARHSTFFRNLFDSMFPPGSDPHIEDDIELVEGCPVVCLADSADDVGYMLHFIVDTRAFDYIPSIANLRSALHMGHKYLIPSLWNDAIRRLRHEFPSALEDYQDTRKYDERHGFTIDEGETLSDLVNVAQEMGIQSILPALLCHLVSTSSLDSLSSDYSPLSLDTRIVLLTGRAKLKSAALRAQYTCRTGRSTHCIRAKCIEGHSRLQAALLCRVALSDGVITGFEEWTDRDARLYGRELCEECVLQVQILTEETQRRLWERLPSFFGLPDWEDLEDPTVVAEMADSA
ncbi:uncharacterized protein SCHCODRAFT_01170455 [Schizophyllum commune H4-8]|uniref:BTB domain-containing protein n=1 Tax=Schizophyllum commune (strain H4-8 / FGSC 9210) TaxID=578458 RepID=D8PZA7_SCHCM|nr:uncharacterized protein SCHCODRAFT_01170455 [Schizophyllum commune H4-8]KAI5896291.1 hypothetical protein SCHCODRAFT_01170455 [Schizophyllum commune H4-8]